MSTPNLTQLQTSTIQPRDTWPEIRAIIEHQATNRPRATQKRIGPSQIGTPCDACLINALAGIEPPRHETTPWLPEIGTAVHEHLSHYLTMHDATLNKPRWLSEHTVTVGEINGQPITGSCDLFDLETGTVSDFKIVGDSTLRKARAAGNTPTYATQIQLYARGFTRQGLKVTTTQVLYLPRNKPNLRDAVTITAPYNETIATHALQRATTFAQWLAAFGAEQVLAATKHTGQEFNCRLFDPSLRQPAINGFSDLLAATNK